MAMLGSPEARQATLQSYLAEIKQRVPGSPALEENVETRMLHMNAPIGGWNEWSPLTYDHNVIGDMLLTENKELKKTKKELEHLIKMLTFPGAGVPPVFPCAFPQPQPRSAVQKVDESEGNLEPVEKQ